jgi:hypothetical protein
LVWRILIFIIGLTTMIASQNMRFSFVSLPFDVGDVGLVIGVVALYLLVNAVRFNVYTFPQKYARWQDSYHCYRCNRITFIQKIEE